MDFVKFVLILIGTCTWIAAFLATFVIGWEAYKVGETQRVIFCLIFLNGLILFAGWYRNKDSQRQQDQTRLHPDERAMRQCTANLQIAYCDAEGDRTVRDIVTCAIYREGDHTYLMAYCQLAGAGRTFRVDRIEELLDKETDAMVDKKIEKWLMKRAEQFTSETHGQL